MLEQLGDALKSVPPEHADEAEAVAQCAQEAVAQAQNEKSNNTLLKMKVENLKQAAETVKAVAPAVVVTAIQIANLLSPYIR